MPRTTRPCNHKGRPDRDSREDRQGLRHGRGRRRPEHHASEEEARRRRLEDVSRSLRTCRSPTRSLRSSTYYKPADDSEEMQYLQGAGARSSAAPIRFAAPRAMPLPVPDLEFFKSQLEGSGDREFSTTMAFVRILTRPPARQGHRPAHRADRSRRGADVRHGRHVPPGRHLFLRRPALHAAGRRSALLLPAKTSKARFSRKASTRAGRTARGSPPRRRIRITACR